jgi:hypothetical protein
MDAAPPSTIDPAGAFKHDALPCFSCIHPPGQEVHVLCPVLLWNLPTAQSKQSELALPSEAVPAGQAWQ